MNIVYGVGGVSMVLKRLVSLVVNHCRKSHCSCSCLEFRGSKLEQLQMLDKISLLMHSEVVKWLMETADASGIHSMSFANVWCILRIIF